MSKRIVVCSDGTWNTADQRNPTNVRKLYLATKDVASGAQVAFYDEGVGVEGRRWDRIAGGAFGRGLNQNIVDAYTAIVERYESGEEDEPGDEIFLFGFSRGAYTARSAAGLIHNAGILKREHAGRIDEAMALYRSEAKPSSEEAIAFRESYAHPSRAIKFVGAWDTVGALGVPGTAFSYFRRRRYRFHDVALSSSIRNAAHALAIDERRRSFRPAVMGESDNFDGELHQSWFAGVHSDVGGGYGRDALSDLTLEWIVGHAEACGLVVDRGKLDLNPSYDGKLHDSRGSFPWRYLPGRSREIEPRPPRVDESVDERIADQGLGYDPKNLGKARNR